MLRRAGLPRQSGSAQNQADLERIDAARSMSATAQWIKDRREHILQQAVRFFSMPWIRNVTMATSRPWSWA